MAKVIVRHGNTVHPDGRIEYHETPATFDHADRIAGKRLDRRRNYAVFDGEVYGLVSWTRECTGCAGRGCRECGHRGRRREAMWQPLWVIAAEFQADSR